MHDNNLLLFINEILMTFSLFLINCRGDIIFKFLRNLKTFIWHVSFSSTVFKLCLRFYPIISYFSAKIFSYDTYNKDNLLSLVASVFLFSFFFSNCLSNSVSFNSVVNRGRSVYCQRQRQRKGSYDNCLLWCSCSTLQEEHTKTIPLCFQ